MKLQDIKDMNKEDLLGVLGLETKGSDTAAALKTLGTFGVGLLVGAGVALLLAPKPGRELRQDLRTRLGRDDESPPSNDAEMSNAAEPEIRRV
jgi:YtxH-like protein